MDLIFVSSPQSEFEHFRKELCYFILTDPYLKQYFDVFLFENLPANERNPQDLYLNMVEEAQIYIALLGSSYGSEDKDGISATEHEYNYAEELNKPRIIFVKKLLKDDHRDPKMETLVERAHDVTYAEFQSVEELKRKVMQSLLFWQQNHN
jgi:hypothetical protein